MLPVISEKDIEEIRNRVDLVELASDYVSLKRSGRRMRGLCPFHTEKTPSFFIDIDKQLYHCFGCGAGGDLFSFVMEIEKLDFSEAVEYLAKRIGYNLTYVTSGRKNRDRYRVFDAMEEAAKIYRKYLRKTNSGKKAVEYLKSRGFTEETLNNFEVGLSPDKWDFVTKKLKEAGFKESILKNGGLSSEGKRGLIDRFRGRIMFPIRDIKGRIVGFGARRFTGGDPKYLNSPETPYFKKGATLYNLYGAKRDIIKKDRCLVVEGYTDVMALDQSGIKFSIATLGTAMTSSHLLKLSRFTKNIYLAFDADSAGKTAAERGLELIETAGTTDVYVITLPEGMDPADFSFKYGSEKIDELMESAVRLEDFVINNRLSGVNLMDSKEKSRAVESIAEVFSKIKDPIIFDDYLRKVSNRLGVSEETIKLKLKQIKGYNVKSRYEQIPEAEERKTPQTQREEEILKLVFANYPQAALIVAERLELEHFSDDILRAIVKKVLERVKSNLDRTSDDNEDNTGNTDSDIKELINSVRKESGERAFRKASILALSASELKKTENWKRVLNELIVYLKESFLAEKIEQKKVELKEAERNGDSKKAESCLSEIHELMVLKRSYRLSYEKSER